MTVKIPKRRVTDLVNFIIARHQIHERRFADNLPKPWTDDPILQQYRFCNVYRELDTVTQWIAQNWRGPHAGDPDMWFSMAVARWVNWPETLEDIGYPVPWKAKHFIATLEKRRTLGAKVWTGAYMIGTQGNAMDKNRFIAEGVLQPLWDNRAALRPKEGDTLASFAQRIINVKNQGRFMVGQIVADVKYADPILLNAPDWFSWAVSGPGSRRGLNRVLERELKSHWTDSEFSKVLTELRSSVNDDLPPWMPRLHAQDLQNCLCEFDKYERVRLGQGRPRSRYAGR